MADPTPLPRHVVVVGGGYTGACAAVQLVRHAPVALHITLVDPAERPGRGLAYRTADPDHRLNAPSFGHSLLPDDAWHFSRWVVAQRLRESDPDSVQPDGTVYVRRGDFGRYLQDTLAAHAWHPATASRIEHRRARAQALRGPADGAPTVLLDDGSSLAADLVVLATGNPPPRRPGWIDAALASHPALRVDPIDDLRVDGVAPGAAVLLVGSGLTALDVRSSLQRRGHRGPLTLLSRRALQPRPNASPAGALAAVRRLEDLDTLPPEAFVARFAAAPPTWLDTHAPDVRRWLHALRARVRQVQADGGSWQQCFDELRDAVWQLWPRLPVEQQRRFLRTLRPWYDVHRFRAPPPNEVLVHGATRDGRVQHVAGRIVSVQADGPRLVATWRPRGGLAEVRRAYDLVVNCTGLDGDAALAAHPLLARAVADGWLRPEPNGWGVQVDGEGCAVAADGRSQPGLRVLGPPSAGHFGDPLGAVFIGAQVQRLLPSMLAAVQRRR